MATAEAGRIAVAACTDVGPQREHNEDEVARFTFDADRAVLRRGTAATEVVSTAWGVALLVLDGMGGQSSGGFACDWTLEALSAWFEQTPPDEVAARGAWLEEALRRASERVARGEGWSSGQMATLGLAFVRGETVHVAHVGDVRAYLLRDGQIERRTRDHTLVNDYRALGYTEEQIAGLPPGILTQAIGSPGLRPHLQSFAVRPGDALLLCCDGLHEFVEDAELAAIVLRCRDPAEACAALVARAAGAGSDDNISALVARVER